MNQLLKLSYDALAEMYPAHLPPLRAGLLLAVCGQVSLALGGWTVKGQEFDANHKRHIYHVTDTGGAWSCDCQNFKNATLQNVYFLGSLARHVCKHISAFAICRGAGVNGLYPLPAASLYDTLSNIVAAQHLPDVGEAWDIPGNMVKLARVNRDGRDVVVLQTGRTRSAALVTWVRNPALPGRGMWHLKHDAWEVYVKFIQDTFGKTPVRSEPVQVSIAAASGDTEFEWGGKDSYGG